MDVKKEIKRQRISSYCQIAIWLFIIVDRTVCLCRKGWDTIGRIDWILLICGALVCILGVCDLIRIRRQMKEYRF